MTHKHQVLHQAATMQLSQVLYVRANEASIQQVVHIKFSAADLVAHVEQLRPFVRKHFEWVYDRKLPMKVPLQWKDIVSGHFDVWRQLNDPVVARHSAAFSALRAKFPEDAAFKPATEGTSRVWHAYHNDDICKEWAKLAKGPSWPVRSIKTEQQVRGVVARQ